MDLRDDPDTAAFRARLRGWLVDHTPDGPVPTLGEGRARFWGDWHRSLHRGGWMGLSWPVEYGGRGLPARYEAILNEEIGRAGAPPAPHVGFLGRALLHFGTDEQRHRFLPGLLSGEEVWCQGFSEPGAGSDLAGLRTSARREPPASPTGAGGGWVVDGQKVWTSDAAWADWCLLLARTDPTVPKHRGISALIVDMHGPGVEVRPIVQINGDCEFNEVFFTGVPVADDRMIGEPGAGWAIAMTTVAYERGPTDVGFSSRYSRAIAHLEAEATAGHLGDLDGPRRQDLVGAHIGTEVLRVHVQRSLAARREGVAPGPEGSIDKLLATAAEQRLHRTALDLHGPGVVLGDHPELVAEWLYSRAASIAGGTSQIQKTILGERLLGLPREPD